ncbi:hypothetical protein JYU34_018881 [Plutella xylostella]|uniref:Uncharacterized protein n=1 Tax=Plutella xylostella TaxID=51655 RepID=A0ABQ7PYS6_PLUXY|nr:hypothetical protein JYU34_018881 [Plutella xylostella]
MAGGRQRHPEAPAGPGAALGSAGLPPPPRSAARPPSRPARHPRTRINRDSLGLPH